MPKVRIDVEQAKGALPLADAVTNPRTVLAPAARMLITLIKLGFKTGTAPDGTKWAPLKFRNGSPLRDKGLLMNSIVPRFGPDYVDIGTNRVGAAVHQFGATIRPVKAKMLRFFAEGSKVPIFRKSVTVPARPFLPLDPSGNASLPPGWQKSFLETVRKRLEGKGGVGGGA